MLLHLNKIMVLEFDIDDESRCFAYGTEPICKQNIPPTDIFPLLEPEEEPDRLMGLKYAHRLASDLSRVLGHGYCTPDMLYLGGDVAGHAYEYESIALSDCINVYQAVRDNPGQIRRVVKQGLQDHVARSSPEDILPVLGSEKAIAALAAAQKSQDSLLDPRNPRILHCSDTFDDKMCSTTKLVLSTEGFSIGINFPEQREVMLDTEENRRYYDLLLSEPLSMSVRLANFVCLESSHQIPLTPFRSSLAPHDSQSKSMELLLQTSDTVQDWPADKIAEKEAKTALKMALQDARHFPSLKADILHLDPGFFHKILVTPRVVETMLREMPPSERKCLYHDENNVLDTVGCLHEVDTSSIAWFYANDCRGRVPVLANFSQSGCRFECMLNGADSFLLNCRPWQFPVTGVTGMPM